MEQLIGHLDKSTILRADENEAFKVVATKFKEALTKLENNGPTAKLWVQYFQMITLVKQFIEAERMGNWQLHLDTSKNASLLLCKRAFPLCKICSSVFAKYVGVGKQNGSG